MYLLTPATVSFFFGRNALIYKRSFNTAVYVCHAAVCVLSLPALYATDAICFQSQLVVVIP